MCACMCVWTDKPLFLLDKNTGTYSSKHRCVSESTLTRRTARWQHIFTEAMDSYATVFMSWPIIDKHLATPCMHDANEYNKDMSIAETVQGSITWVLLPKVPQAVSLQTTTLQVKAVGVGSKTQGIFHRNSKPPRMPGGVYRDYLRSEATDRTRRSTFLDSLKLFRWEFHRASGTDWYECFSSLLHICI